MQILMPLAAQSIAEQLASADVIKFETALSQIDAASNAHSDAQFFIAACERLSGTALVGSTERSRQQIYLVARASQSRDGLTWPSRANISS